jgi:hypothetical protein
MESNESINITDMNNSQNHNNIDQTINYVITRSQASKNQSTTDNVKKIKNNKKRTISLNDDTDKRTKLDITIDNFGETSRLINIIFERLDSVEDECNRFDSANVILKNELKDLMTKYNKLSSKHSNLLKDFDALKITNSKLQNDLNNLDSKIMNQSVDEMNGSSNIQLTTSTFADILKPKKDKSVSEPMVEIINTINEYSNQKKGRENNIIIFGIKNVKKENSSDQVKNLFRKMKIENIKFKNPVLLMKNGATNDSPPIKITLESEEVKFHTLKAAKCLKEINHNDKTNIRISQDLSEIDRMMHKKLLIEKKLLNDKLIQENINDFYYGIRGNKVIKIMK